jgi:hypothetical protein
MKAPADELSDRPEQSCELLVLDDRASRAMFVAEKNASSREFVGVPSRLG